LKFSSPLDLWVLMGIRITLNQQSVRIQKQIKKAIMQTDYDNDLQSYFTDMEHLRGMFKEFIMAEKIAREREPGDGSTQRSVVEQIEAAL
jgi:hypothetical protein